MPNRLAAATSPYLLQHADNPVDRREWAPDAFAEAGPAPRLGHGWRSPNGMMSTATSATR